LISPCGTTPDTPAELRHNIGIRLQIDNRRHGRSFICIFALSEIVSQEDPDCACRQNGSMRGKE